MLNVNQLIGFGAGGDDTIAFTSARGSAYYNASNYTAYGYIATFPLVPSPSRHVLVGYTAAGGGASTSATIGGVAATKIAENVSGGLTCGFYIAAVPTGASGNVSVHLSETATGMIMYTWGLDGLHTTVGASSSASGTSINVSSGANAPAAYFYAILSTGGFFSMGGTSVVNADTTTSNTTAAYGPARESTSYFHGLADFRPHEYGGSATCNVSISSVISAVALW